jgi:glycosyltransferase involved in cell wall biosynthesis
MNILVRWERYRALKLSGEQPGTTIVIVNFNTLDILKTTVAAVKRYTGPGTKLIVVDNGSKDGSREWLSGQRNGLVPVLLRTNLGHGRALDIGICRATTSRVLLMDSDAFPVTQGWLESLERQMCSQNLLAIGMRGRRNRLHPACALINRDHYLKTRVSMAVHSRFLEPGEKRELGVNSWDCAELFSLTIPEGRRQLIDTTPTPYGGDLIGGLVYHHRRLTELGMESGGSMTPHHDLWAAARGHYLAE